MDVVDDNGPKSYETKIKELEKGKIYIDGIENLVFNGGGAKCLAQIGTLKVFDSLDILNNIRRFAGTSGGALTAAFAALGYTPDEIEEIVLKTNFNELIEKISWGKRFKLVFSVIWSYITGKSITTYGLHTAEYLEEWLGQQIKNAPKIRNMANLEDKENVTFEQLYKECRVELAVTATDVTRRYCEVFHAKTHPDMPIKKALRMSISIPGYFTPVEFKEGNTTSYDRVGVYVDGGVLLNYPVMCFDGWYLSMKPEDSLLKRYFKYDTIEKVSKFEHLQDCRFQDVENRRFVPAKPNLKTVGVMVYSALDDDVVKSELNKRVKKCNLVRKEKPDTKLKRDRVKKLNQIKTVGEEMTVKTDIMIRWMAFLNTLIVPTEESFKLDDVRQLIDIARTSAQTGNVEGHDMERLRQTYPQLRNAMQRIDGAGTGIQPNPLNRFRTNTRLLEMVINLYLPRHKTETDHDICVGFLTTLTELVFPTEDEFNSLFDNPIRDSLEAARIIFRRLAVGEGERLNYRHLERYAVENNMQFMKQFPSTIPPSKHEDGTRYFLNVFGTVMDHLERTQLKPFDIERTIGINTEYLQTLDFDMKKEDKEYLIHQGEVATISFLEYVIKREEAPAPAPAPPPAT